ncbi:MAG: hypothetical protein PGN16_04085 [Sphingomonas phyllosphaerae]|uniref:hypothetical protein n=1 Tax=Sphingomonas phyllosphaerae TaxID=257003 RepID=UPI002FF915BB
MTADAAEIVRLAKKVEQATGPDRELDQAIWFALFGPDKDMHRIIARGSFNYTASLDAAMTLVPDGLWKRINVDPYGRANIRLGDACAVTAATPALALTAAALRARAAQHDNEVG